MCYHMYHSWYHTRLSTVSPTTILYGLIQYCRLLLQYVLLCLSLSFTLSLSLSLSLPPSLFFFSPCLLLSLALSLSLSPSVSLIFPPPPSLFLYPLFLSLSLWLARSLARSLALSLARLLTISLFVRIHIYGSRNSSMLATILKGRIYKIGKSQPYHLY